MSVIQTTDRATKHCSYSRFLEYMKSNKMPDIPGYEKCSVIHIDDNGEHIVKLLRKKLPVSKVASMILGGRYANFQYNMKYDDKMIVSITKNPEQIGKYFQYEETVTVMDNNDGTIEIIREVTTINFTQGMVITSFIEGNIEDNYHRQCLAYLDAIVEECK